MIYFLYYTKTLSFKLECPPLRKHIMPTPTPGVTCNTLLEQDKTVHDDLPAHAFLPYAGLNHSTGRLLTDPI